MIEHTIKCDGCRKMKADANRWIVGTAYYLGDGCFYGFAEWHKGCEAKDHFCGMECALKRLNEHLESKPGKAA